MTTRGRRERRLAAVLGAGALCGSVLVGGFAVPAAAAGALVVDWPSDGFSAVGRCGLRDAIASANTDSAVGGCAAGSPGADVITFDASVFRRGSPSPIQLTADLIVADDLTIDATGAGVIVDGAGAWKFVIQGPAAAVFDHVVVAHTPCALKGTGGSDGTPRSTVDVVDSQLVGGICGDVDDGGDVTVTRTTIIGGGVGGDGRVTVTDSTVSGGSVFGGYYGNVATVTRSTITGPSSRPGVGGWKGSVSVTGSTVSGFGTGVSEFEGDVTVSGSMITGNGWAVDDGTSILISGSTLSRNTGGGVRSGRGAVTITGTTLADNGGPGIETTDFGVPLTVRDSTISGNNVGISLTGDEQPTRIINSTIADNRAPRGAAVLVHDTFQPLVLTLDAASVVWNTSEAGGALADDSDYPVTLHAHNTLLTASAAGGGACGGQWLVDGSANLADEGSCGSSFQVVTSSELKLSPLQDNGGPTQTVALRPGSVAIGAGDASLLPAGVSFDQRGAGFVRASGGALDVGAYELQVIGGSLTLGALPGRMLAGTRIQLRGAATPARAGGDTTRPVEIWFRPARTASWTRIAVVTASSASGWSYRVSAVARESGSWRALAPATTAYLPLASPTLSVRAIAKVVGWPGGAASNLAPGIPVIRTLTVVPGYHRYVVVQYRACLRCAWRTAAAPRTDARSRVKVAVSAPRRGSLWYRIVVPRTSASLGAVTGTWRIY